MYKEGKSGYGVLFGFSAVVFYGLFVRLTFGAQELRDYLGLITIGLIFIAPFVFGFLTMALMPRKYKTAWVPSIFLPWLSCVLVIIVVLALALEAWICVVMALPIYLSLSSLGGILFCALARRRMKPAPQTQQMLAVALILLPYSVSLVEHLIPSPTSVRTVESQVVIDAPAEAVWAQITSVPQIQADEQHVAAFRLAGVPRPVEAMLVQGGVGEIRHSTYSGNLLFVEEVIEWEPGRRYRFTIDLDPASVPPWPWSQIGGRDFDLLDGEYRIEPLNDRQVMLHLQSRHRLTTKINTYGGWWTEFLLGDIQNYILSVVKHRAEAATS